ncbi:hypothetical protein ES319_A12G061400v1 [Gossypium barbadense]|uniref:Uncharacterized protein n=1 Tax=Gossypium barbadense TaxID=3634 RepID=A0A5J5TAR8_GOSBA|nr:hypothetical protein ES319_A12G061400v1 [Gossypium barbadense]UQE86413.1 GASA protein [Gossypium barbadense]
MRCSSSPLYNHTLVFFFLKLDPYLTSHLCRSSGNPSQIYRMALSTNMAASLVLFSLLLLHFTQAEELMSIDGAPSPSPQAQPIDCGVACEGRCRLSKRPNLCKRSCGSCCHRCKCVPPGTSGNYEACPCYANLTTRKNVRKCP